MTKRDDTRPTGWVLPVPENNEGRAIAEAWIEQHKELLDLLTTTIAKDLENHDGDSLMCWWRFVQSLADELHRILTHREVEVQPDQGRQ